MIKLNDAMDSIEAQDCVPKADNAKETEKAEKIFRCDEENCNTLAKAKEALMEDTTGGEKRRCKWSWSNFFCCCHHCLWSNHGSCCLVNCNSLSVIAFRS